MGESSLIPLSKDAWNALQGKPKWDIMSALRGPDCKNPELIKYFSTAVIRGKLAKAIRVGGMVNSRLGFVIVPAPSYRLMELGETRWDPHGMNHFFAHVQEAASWLNIPVVSLKPADYFKTVGSLDKPSEALSALHHLLKTLDKDKADALAQAVAQDWGYLL